MEFLKTLPALERACRDFNDKIIELKEKDKEKSIAAAGKTKAKRGAELKLINNVIGIASPIFAWAMETGNNEVKELTNIRKSYLAHVRDTELIKIVESVHKIAVDNLNNLADYGVTSDKVSELKTDIDEYYESLGMRESGVAERKSAGVSVKALFYEADEILKNRIDRLMEVFKAGQPDFYNIYRAARIIRDL